MKNILLIAFLLFYSSLAFADGVNGGSIVGDVSVTVEEFFFVTTDDEGNVVYTSSDEAGEPDLIITCNETECTWNYIY